MKSQKLLNLTFENFQVVHNILSQFLLYATNKTHAVLIKHFFVEII